LAKLLKRKPKGSLVSGVRARDSQTNLPIDRVVKVIEQELNPNYPKSTPKGGTGKGIWIR